MEKFSTYGFLGIPEGIATALLLFWFSLSLAPWLGGTDIGTIKIPRLSARMNHWLRMVGPLGCILLAGGFLKIWPESKAPLEITEPQLKAPLEITRDEYIHSFFNTTKEQQITGKLFSLSGLNLTLFRQRWGRQNGLVVSVGELFRSMRMAERESTRYPNERCAVKF
jgi:hypothetical protein